MDTNIQYLLLALALTSVQISFTESRLNEKRRDKTERRYHSVQAKDNMCEITNRESKVHCYCENTEVKTATRADCWVFNGGIDETDPIWSSFNSQPHLERLTFNLFIHYATLNKIGKDSFRNMSTLREITLMNDKIMELDFSAFSSLPALVNLTIKGNKVTEIQRDVFVDLPSLKYLDLSFNSISLAHDGCFEHLNVLNDLVLEANLISVLTKDTFKGLANLTRLDLRSNKMSMVGDLTFSELWNLNELLLDNNELKYLSERAFDGLAMLQKLSMTGNKLQTINEGLLEGVRGLELLDLRNNEIELFTYETIKPILENLKMKTSVLYLSGNDFRCDCRLSWIQVLRNETKSEPLRTALDEITCSFITVNKATPKTNLENSVKILHPFKTEANIDVIQQNDNDEDGSSDISSQYKFETTTKLFANEVILVDIPPETLSCPGELVATGEDSLMLSSKDESYWHSNSCMKTLSSFLMMLTLVIMYTIR
ncbi:unnamed protein product [Danaus chrysippus]|uniref:(African queen) hypothetical protein n=1 Tax=Danaus chrysippus TaxID=151541 RepID=A0A8J2R3J3_9NEOP|nr:unnamed protein product [Danaus chrysippus]